MKAKQLLFTLFLTCMPILMWAEQKEYTDENNLVYVYDTETGTAWLKAGSYNMGAGSPDAKGNIVIPSQIEVNDRTYTVEKIAERAFHHCYSITSVEISEGIKTVGSYAFSECTGLQSISLPESLTDIGTYGTFYHCENLRTIVLPSKLKNLGNLTFIGCSNLTDVDLAQIESIGYQAFVDCISLSSIKIPQSVIKIDMSGSSNLFRGCAALNFIEVELGNRFFDSRNDCNAIINTASNELIVGCNGTKIPTTVTAIGTKAFQDSGIKDLSIPLSVKKIGDRAFFRCEDLVQLDLPEGITSIEEWTFCYCTNLASVSLPSSLKTIGRSAFEFCTSLNEVVFPQNLTTICKDAFRNCNLEKIVFNEGLLSIETGAFMGENEPGYGYGTDQSSGKFWGYNLKSIELPSTLKEIGDKAFYGWRELTSLTIPASVESIGAKAFGESRKLERVTSLIESPFALPNDAFQQYVQSYYSTDIDGTTAYLYVPIGTKEKYEQQEGWKQFRAILEIGTEIKEMEFVDENNGVVYLYEDGGITARVKGGTKSNPGSPNAKGNITILEEIEVGGKTYKVTKIDSYAFYKLKQIVSVSVPNSVETIGVYAFYGCNNLETVTLGENITQIGDFVFSYTGLKSIQLPQKLTAISKSLFSHCEKLGNIDIPESVTEIKDEAFRGCLNMTSIYIPSNVRKIGLNIFSGYENYNGSCYGNVNKVVVANSNPYYDSRNDCNAIIETATNTLIQGCQTTVIPDGVKKIGLHAFEFVAYKDFYLPASVDSIDTFGFYGTQIENVTIPSTLKYIGWAAFSKNSKLKNVVFEDGLEAIDGRGFTHCDNLQSVHISKTLKAFGAYPFNECVNLKEITVDVDNPYLYSPENSNTVITKKDNVLVLGCTGSVIPDGVKSISTNAFQGSGITSVVFPSSVEEIGYTSFWGCLSLNFITFPAKLRHIKWQAFGNCPGLGAVTSLVEDPSSISIDEDVFRGLPSETVLYVPQGSKPKYEATAPWKSFSKILEIEDYNPAYKRKVVVEEGTGTWCQWCPRGIVGIQTMMENHPDDFIPIAVHVNDEMETDTYETFVRQNFSAFPTCTMDRLYHFDPNATSLEDYYQKEIESSSSSISMMAKWNDDDKTSVTITTTTQFAHDMDDDYRIAYVITENQVGPYIQKNAYAGGGEGPMGGFENENPNVSIFHNHVARFISDVKGTKGTVPSSPEGGVDHTYSYSLVMPDNIQNKDNIEIIVLLINRESEIIENADRILAVDILDYNSSGIMDIVVDHGNSDVWYTLDGVRLSGRPKTKGIYVNNGKKVLVK